MLRPKLLITRYMLTPDELVEALGIALKGSFTDIAVDDEGNLIIDIARGLDTAIEMAAKSKEERTDPSEIMLAPAKEDRTEAPAEAGSTEPAEAAAPPDEPEKPKGGPLARGAGIMCGEKGFRTWLKMEKKVNVSDAEEAAVWLRKQVGVESRAELDSDPEAARKFRQIDREYTSWLNV